MARKRLDFTLDEVQQEVVDICNFLSQEILEVLGKNFYLACLDQPLVGYSENDETGCRDLIIDDIKESPLAHDIACAFDYAKGYRFGDINDPENFLDGMGLFRSLTEHLSNHIEDSTYKFLYDVTNARWTLDNGDYLNFKELALLAGVDERTVRNAASSKDENCLKIQKSGGSTIVNNDEAKRWLSSRPDYKPTEYIKDTTLDTPRYFEDETGFGRYLSHRREELGLPLDEIASTVGVSVDVITDLETGVDRVNLSQVGKLCSILQEDRSRFMKDYMRIFHLEALADLKGYEYRTNDNSESAEKLAKVKLMIFKQQLKLEAQMDIIQNQKKVG
jgi:transcriptional regulator with XRE-family HTH domain